MKPNFALSLSFEGIRLLHRAAGGWRVVGDVALDAPDMAAELAVLRRTATALDPSGLRTKVLLPNAQIKYLTVDTEGLPDDARRSAAAKALGGATPYAVADLAFDISSDGERTHVAAVARETLQEAEEFALEHRFNPISFAAVPGDNAFLGEPFFGPAAAALAALADGETIEPEGIAVVIIGDAEETSNDAPVVTVPDAQPLAETAQETPLDTATDAEATEVEGGTAPAATDDPAASDVPQRADTVAIAVPENDVQTADIPVSEDSSAITAPAASQDNIPTEDPGTPAAIDTIETPQTDTAPQPAAFKTKPVIVASRADTPKSDQNLVIAQALLKAQATPSAGFASRRGDTKAATQLRKEPPVAAGKAETPAAAPVTPKEPAAAPAVQAPPKKAATPAPAARSAAAPFGRFLSRRQSNDAAPAKAAPIPAPKSPASNRPAPKTETERMTIFGAREAPVGGKPRFLGLVLTAVLLVFLAGVAAWASVFLDDGLNLSRLFGDRSEREVVEDTTTAPEQTAAQPQEVQTAALDATLTPEDTAVLDALRDPKPATAEETQRDIEARYATSGVWSGAPLVPPVPSGAVSIDDFYRTGIDPVSTANDAVALPSLASLNTDLAFGTVASPAPAGTQFEVDASGLLIPTAAGAISPDGFTLFLGRPPITPPATRARFAAVPQDAPATTALSGTRPRPRPNDLAEQNERATLNGATLDELSSARPRLRPRSAQEDAAAAAAAAIETDAAVETALADAQEAEPAPFATATALAATASARPDPRPRNFNRIVRRAQRATQQAEQRAEQQETRVASRQVAPRVVTPRNPTRQSVARAATQTNQLNLRKVNLIGIYGKPANRRALIRLGNGRYKEVKVGGRVDGGRVSAIGESELRYTKGSRNLVLRMPQ